jgi:hypothetical protein
MTSLDVTFNIFSHFRPIQRFSDVITGFEESRVSRKFEHHGSRAKQLSFPVDDPHRKLTKEFMPTSFSSREFSIGFPGG